MRRLLSLLLVLVLLAGCLGGSNEATGDEQPSHMPRKSIFDGMHALDETDTTWLETYGMEKNPGRADPDQFSTQSGLVPETAYVALYAAAGDRNRLFTAATLHYATDGQVDDYLDGHGECKTPTVGRTILVDHQDVTILVAGLELNGQDAELMAALHQAEQDVMERTGATIKC